MTRRTFGNVRRLPSGRVQARYRVGLDWVNAPDTFDTARAADDWLAGQQVALSKGTWSDPRKAAGLPTVAQLVAEYVDARVADPDKPLSPDTATTYRASLAGYLESTPLGRTRADQATVAQVRAWYTDAGARSLSQAKKAYRLLAAAYGRAVDDEVLTNDPVRIKGASSPVPPRRRVAGLAELDAILAELPARWQLLVILGAWVGPRWGELRGLRRRDVDTAAGTVLLAEQLDTAGVRRSTKAGHPGDDDLVHVPPHLLPILVAHLAEHVEQAPDALLFTGDRGAALSHSYFSKRWRLAQDAAGIDPANRLQLHDLRRTAGTWATQLGNASLAVVMRRLRHRTVAAAMSYQVADSTDDRAVAARLSAALEATGSSR